MVGVYSASWPRWEVNFGHQILCDKKVRLAVRLRFFDRVITPAALAIYCFWPSNNPDGRLGQTERCFSQKAAYDCQTPNFGEWNAPWHDILHHWNGKAVALAQQHGLKTWSEQCLKQHWKLAMHVANFPPNRWVKRVLLWNPTGQRKRGYPRHDWTSKLTGDIHVISTIGYNWQMLAQDRPLWMQLSDDFVKASPLVDVLVSHCLRPKGAAFGHAGAKPKSSLILL